MNDQDLPSLATRIVGPIVFLIGATAALFWFGYNLYILLANLNAGTVYFDKGAFYMLGVGMGMATLAFVLAYEFWYGKTLPTNITRLCSKLAYASILLLFITPHAMHFFTGSYLANRGLTVCEEASSQWLFVSEIFYISDERNCDKILSESQAQTR